MAAIFALALALAGAAPSEMDRLVAQRELKEGNLQFAQGQYQQALDHYQAAYKRVPSARLFFNFAQAFRQLGRDVEAVDFYERFLAEATDVAPQLRGEAQQHLGATLGRIGTAQVSADVDGAEVLVDGRARGTTPLPGPIRLSPGPHQVVVQPRGSDAPPFVERIEVAAGKTVLIKARFADRKVAAAPAAPIPAAAPSIAIAPPPPPPRGTPALRRVGQLAVATGAVLAVAGGIILGTSWAKYGEAADGGCLERGAGACEADARFISGRNTQALILLGGAVAAGAAGGVLWWANPVPSPRGDRSDLGLAAGAAWRF
jgi:hypothetical protein